MVNNKQQLYLGVDGGGSKCKAVILNASLQILGEGVCGSANPFHGLTQAQNSIVEASYLALDAAGLEQQLISELIAGVGLAGVNLPKYFDLMAHWQHPFKTMHLATDLHIACLGAHGGENGAIMISGTGSSAYICANGESLIIGGHGFELGDICGGAWFGRQAVKKVLLAQDNIIAPTSLTEKIFNQLNCTDANSLIETVAGQGASYFAQLAVQVFDAADAGDAVATAIVQQGCQYFFAVFNKLMAKAQVPMALIGGLIPRLKPWLPNTMAEYLTPPKNPPEIGAVIFAINQTQASVRLAVN